MKDILKYLKWIIVGQGIGVVCAFVAYFLPFENDNYLKSGLFVFGIMMIVGYWLYIIKNVYSVLKREE